MIGDDDYLYTKTALAPLSPSHVGGGSIVGSAAAAAAASPFGSLLSSSGSGGGKPSTAPQQSVLSLAAASGVGFATPGIAHTAPLTSSRNYDQNASCNRCSSLGIIYVDHKRKIRLCWRCCPCTLCDSKTGAVCEMGFCGTCYTPMAGPRLR